MLALKKMIILGNSRNKIRGFYQFLNMRTPFLSGFRDLSNLRF